MKTKEIINSMDQDISKLFMDTCTVLKDNLVIELKENNNFLRSLLIKSNNRFVGIKVIILPFENTIDGILINQKTEGYIISMSTPTSSHQAEVMVVDEENNGRIIFVHKKHLVFENADKIFNL